MEAAPRGLDVDGVRRDLGALADVRSVHDLHVWTLGQGRVALSCHLVVARVERSEALLTDAYTLLGTRHRIDHATIQVEPESLADASPRSVCALGCDPARGGLAAMPLFVLIGHDGPRGASCARCTAPPTSPGLEPLARAGPDPPRGSAARRRRRAARQRGAVRGGRASPRRARSRSAIRTSPRGSSRATRCARRPWCSRVRAGAIRLPRVPGDPRCELRRNGGLHPPYEHSASSETSIDL